MNPLFTGITSSTALGLGSPSPPYKYAGFNTQMGTYDYSIGLINTVARNSITRFDTTFVDVAVNRNSVNSHIQLKNRYYATYISEGAISITANNYGHIRSQY